MGSWKPRLGRMEAMWAKVRSGCLPSKISSLYHPRSVFQAKALAVPSACEACVSREASDFFGHFWSAAKSVTATGVAGKGVGKRELFSFFSTLEIIYPKNRPSTFLVILEIFSSTGRELG